MKVFAGLFGVLVAFEVQALDAHDWAYVLLDAKGVFTTSEGKAAVALEGDSLTIQFLSQKAGVWSDSEMFTGRVRGRSVSGVFTDIDVMHGYERRLRGKYTCVPGSVSPFVERWAIQGDGLRIDIGREVYVCSA